MPTWKRRYFTLVHNRLIYFDDVGGSRKGDFVLTRTTLVKESDLKPYGFSVHDAEDPKRILYMAASTNAERSEWMREIVGDINTLIVAHNDKTSYKPPRPPTVSNASKFKGEVDTLEVAVLKGRNIYALKSHVLLHPYVLVKVGTDEYRTLAAPADSYPEWNETLHIPFDRSIRYITFEVWYIDGVTGKDVHLASFTLNVFSIGPGNSVLGWHSLVRQTINQPVYGEVLINAKTNLKYEPYSRQLLQSISVLPELSLLAWMNLSAVASSRLQNIIDFPGENLYDVALNVALSASITGFSFFSQGILMLTNYRIIFVSLNRLRELAWKIDDDINRTETKDLVVYALIPTITSVVLKVTRDPKTAVSSESISIRTNDCKVCYLRDCYVCNER